MPIILRDVTPEDEGFLRQVYACTREQELAMVPWTAEQTEAFLRFQFDAQDSHYHAHYPEASYQVILKEMEPVGRLYVNRGQSEIKILDITLLPPFRNAGIGTGLLRDLLGEAEQTGKTVTIWVEHFNPSQNLFKRLGFASVQEDGYNKLLEWRQQ